MITLLFGAGVSASPGDMKVTFDNSAMLQKLKEAKEAAALRDAAATTSDSSTPRGGALRKLAGSDICANAADYDGTAYALGSKTACDASPDDCWTCDEYFAWMGYGGFASVWTEPYATCSETYIGGTDMTEKEYTGALGAYCCNGGDSVCDHFDDDFYNDGCGIGPHPGAIDCKCKDDGSYDCTEDTLLNDEELKCLAKKNCIATSDVVGVIIGVVVGLLVCGCGCAALCIFAMKNRSAKTGGGPSIAEADDKGLELKSDTVETA